MRSAAGLLTVAHFLRSCAFPFVFSLLLGGSGLFRLLTAGQEFCSIVWASSHFSQLVTRQPEQPPCKEGEQAIEKNLQPRTDVFPPSQPRLGAGFFLLAAIAAIGASYYFTCRRFWLALGCFLLMHVLLSFWCHFTFPPLQGPLF
jgi:hypothetical protein